MNPMLPAHVPVLRITYIDNVLDPSGSNPIFAQIYRGDTHFVAECSAEDIRIYLQTLADTAPYTQSDDGITALREMAKHLTSGVNKYSLKEFSVIEAPDRRGTK